MTSDQPRGRPLTDRDLARIRADATLMVGYTGLGGDYPPLSWDEVKAWDAVSAEDALSLVEEVDRLRADLTEAARLLTALHERLLALGHIEGDRELGELCQEVMDTWLQ